MLLGPIGQHPLAVQRRTTVLDARRYIRKTDDIGEAGSHAGERAVTGILGRLAPLPPTSAISARPISSNQRIASIATSSVCNLSMITMSISTGRASTVKVSIRHGIGH